MLVFGCTSSQPVDVAAHPRVRPKAMVEFDVHGRREQLDSVVVTGDSISGIPWHDAQRCCTRVAYALPDISKPRIRKFSSLGTILTGVGVLFALYLIALAEALSSLGGT
jgi:hypothetical protein